MKQQSKDSDSINKSTEANFLIISGGTEYFE